MKGKKMNNYINTNGQIENLKSCFKLTRKTSLNKCIMRKRPLETKPSVHLVRDFGASRR